MPFFLRIGSNDIVIIFIMKVIIDTKFAVEAPAFRDMNSSKIEKGQGRSAVYGYT